MIFSVYKKSHLIFGTCKKCLKICRFINVASLPWIQPRIIEVKNARGDAVRETQGGSRLGTIQNSLRDHQSLAVVSLRRRRARMRRGKRTFGQTMEDELVLTSLRGLETGKSTMKYFGW